MKKKIFLIGNFGFGSNRLNGQIVRTRTIYETLKKYMKPNNNTQVRYMDTSIKGGIITKLIIYLKAMIEYIRANSVVLLPAQRAIKFLVPAIVFLNYFFKKKLHFVAIGGWLEDFLLENANYIKYFKGFAFVYVQTVSLKGKLETLGITNVVHLPNYRLYNQQIRINRVEQVRNIVFFSRVTPKKGVNIAIESIETINKLYGYNLKIDIIGPIDDLYKDEFRKIINNNENTNYLGVLDPTDILDAISKYDLLIFPTFYEGEGFPGTILDSMTAGVPIVASDWKYNSEVLCDGYTGLLFETKNIDDLIDKIVYLVNNTEKLNEMKENCIEESKKYSADSVAKILIDRFN